MSHQLPGYRTVEDAEHRRQCEDILGPAAGQHQPEAGPDRRRDVPRPGKGAAQGDLDRRHQPRRQPARPAPRPPGLAQGPARRRSGRLPPDRDDAASPTCSCPRPSGARRSGPAPTASAWSATARSCSTPPGEALPDWEIIAGFARALGYSGFDFANAAEVWDEFIGLTAGRPCDMAGMTARAGCAARPVLQWPCPTPDHPGTQAALSRPALPDAGRPGRVPAARPPRAARAARPRVPASS